MYGSPTLTEITPTWLLRLIEDARSEPELRALAPWLEVYCTLSDATSDVERLRAAFERRMGKVAVGAVPRRRRRLFESEARRFEGEIRAACGVAELTAIETRVRLRYPEDPRAATLETLIQRRREAIVRIAGDASRRESLGRRRPRRR